MPSFRSFSSLLTLVRTRHTRAAAQRNPTFHPKLFGNIYTDHEEVKTDVPLFCRGKKEIKKYTPEQIYGIMSATAKYIFFQDFAERESKVCR